MLSRIGLFSAPKHPKVRHEAKVAVLRLIHYRLTRLYRHIQCSPLLSSHSPVDEPMHWRSELKSAQQTQHWRSTQSKNTSFSLIRCLHHISIKHVRYKRLEPWIYVCDRKTGEKVRPNEILLIPWLDECVNSLMLCFSHLSIGFHWVSPIFEYSLSMRLVKCSEE